MYSCFLESQPGVHCQRRHLHKLVGFGRALSMLNCSRISIARLLTGYDETLPNFFKIIKR